MQPRPERDSRHLLDDLLTRGAAIRREAQRARERAQEIRERSHDLRGPAESTRLADRPDASSVRLSSRHPAAPPTGMDTSCAGRSAHRGIILLPQ